MKGKNDTLLFIGFILVLLFGSALDSAGWGLWVAAAGVVAGAVLVLVSGREEKEHEAVPQNRPALVKALRKRPVRHGKVAPHPRPGQAPPDVLGKSRVLGVRKDNVD